MAIRRLSYRLVQEPDTGAVRPIPAEPGEHQEKGEIREFGAAVERIIGAGSGLSYSLLPDGGRLLCAALPGRRVEALHLGADTPGPGPVWPIDTWRSAAWDPGAADTLAAGFVESELPVPEAHFDRARLVDFARAHADRVAPFLTDVRRLFDDPAGRQIVLVEEDPETVAHWVALACASLPEAYVPALTFTTGTTDPRGAPQQIIGIGPAAGFDRADEATVTYLYRVHDGTGGPQSPPAEFDAWAELAAERWISGNPPRPAPGAAVRAGDAFALLPLISGGIGAGTGTGKGTEAEAGTGGEGAAGALPGADLAGLGGDRLRKVFDALTRSVVRGEADSRTLDALERLCRGLEGEQALAARSLALALVKHHLDAPRAHDALPDLTVFEGLPLGQEAWRQLREEYGDRADDALRRSLRGPVPTWAEPLRLALAVGADGGPGLAEAMDRLASSLLRPDRRDCAHAVRVLEEVDHLPFTHRVLRLLIVDFTDRKLDRLRELARSPQGDWLRRHIDEAPLTVRLAEAAARWTGPPDHLRGAELFRRLTELLPGQRVTDVTTLRLLWHIVWRNTPPDRAEQPWIARTCTPRLIVEADLGRRIIGWLGDPDRCDPELVGFARDMRDDGLLGATDRHTADLLVTAQDLADGRLGVTRSSLERLEELFRKVSPKSPILRQGIGERVGRALAGANPLDVCEHGLRLLFTAGPELLGTYRAYFLDERTRDRLLRELPHRSAELAAYFHVWRPRRRHGVSEDWRRTAAELLDEVLAPVLVHVDEHHLGRVATVLQRENQDVQEWTAWRHQIKQRYA
ncbi:GTPase-associated protein 1-related protein [Streptomyces sp. NPDC015345]|uniref:GTPase-associated protein 1-related protein n=1 Tax=Streptomyces sp. NPDC015345 TaxID=3364953 RepID=UPI0036F7CBCB